MFPSARNSLRRWNEHGNSKIPIPIAVKIHNFMTELGQSSEERKKWFRPEHGSSLLPIMQLDIVTGDGTIVYSRECSTSAHPCWEHLDERINLPEEWWLDEDSYKTLKLQFKLRKKDEADEEENIARNLDRNNMIFFEVPLHPATLQRLNITPDSYPPNACFVYFSDGSTRIPQSIFQIFLDKKLTEPPPIEDFSRFEDDVFRMLDNVAESPSPRARSASSLLDPDSDKSLIEAAAKQFPRNLHQENELNQRTRFLKTEADSIQSSIKTQREFLESLIEQEEAELHRELCELREEQKTLENLNEDAKRVEEDIAIVNDECKIQSSQLYKDQFKRETQCTKLLRELRSIYPITLDSQKGYLIRNLQLPVDMYTTTVSEEEISASLGFCCHLVFLMSKYLSVTLRHKLYCNSSRSAVLQDGTSAFPLFTARSVEREKLDCGLSLMGANVDCILMTYKIEYTPTSHILARIKRIYDEIIEGNPS